MSSTVITQTAGRTLGNRLLISVGALFMGLSLVYFAGFSHLELVHNAAHDTRHSSGFPCH
ncbi:CbtB-domain containing protein [Pseudomonas sp. NPDC090202]|uniref:CbtB domain-containing protein n=1 Tax=unclassified Pseudomonas TaxID=196821 RepID=UPI003800844D